MTRETTHPPPPALYRYGQRRYLEPFVASGRVSMALADTYRDTLLCDGQRDDETARTLADGTRLQFTGRNRKPLIYYLLCFSLVYDPVFFTTFKADACVKINNPEAFGDRLLAEARRQVPDQNAIQGCDLYGRPLLYYPDGFWPSVTDQIELIFSKNQRFAYQREFRVIFATDPLFTMKKRIEFVLGDMTDIAEFL